MFLSLQRPYPACLAHFFVASHNSSNLVSHSSHLGVRNGGCTGYNIILVAIIATAIVMLKSNVTSRKVNSQSQSMWHQAASLYPDSGYYYCWVSWSSSTSNSVPTDLSLFLWPWILDSGTTDDMSGNQTHFYCLSFLNSMFFDTLADGSRIPIHCIGQTQSFLTCPKFYLICL